MNENYLWDRSGTDAEIEELEELLSVFRHQSGEAPVIAAPANVIAFPQRQSSRHYAWAIAASVAIAVLAGGWFLLQRPNSEVADGRQAIRTAVTEEPKFSAPENEVVRPRPTEIKDLRRTSEFARRPDAVKALYKTGGARVRAPKPAKKAVQLTKEEQYAYNQLLLALSITSSKLNVVRDTISQPEATSRRADK